MTHIPNNAVAVLGGGSWGTGLAHILATHGYDTLLWLRDKKTAKEVNTRHTNRRYLKGGSLHDGVRATVDLRAAVSHAEVILVVIPSKAFRAIASEIGGHITGDQVLISATKGLEGEGLTRMTQILQEETCARKVGALSGPNLAAEVVAGHPSATVVASYFEEVIEKADRLLAGPRFKLYGNTDLVGVELAGALKNIYAIAGGVSAGLGFGDNTRSALITRGLSEMSRLGELFGADRLTFQGLAGVGDLVATCSSTLSRNHTVGRHLSTGEPLEQIVENLGMVAEGVNTTRAVHSFALAHGVDMPIAAAVHRLLFEGATPELALAELMERPSRYEDHHGPIQGGGPGSYSVVEVAARSRRDSS
jgi:glycerol-3-phosphate dehydrogenase (NAD(P)+)